MDTGGGGINGAIHGAMDVGGVPVDVQVPDAQASLDHVVRLGGQVLMPFTTIDGVGVTLATFADAEDHRIGLMKGGRRGGAQGSGPGSAGSPWWRSRRSMGRATA